VKRAANKLPKRFDLGVAPLRKTRPEQLNKYMDEIIKHLGKADDGTIRDLHSFHMSLIEEENARTSGLDAKAGAIMGLVSVAVTMMFSLGGAALGKLLSPDARIAFGLHALILVLYGVSVVMFVLAVLFAFLGFRVRRDFMSFNPQDVFGPASEGNVADYMKRCILARFEIYITNRNVNDKKAALISRACSFLFVAVLCIAPMACVLAFLPVPS